ncbi:MAG: InlB B-repeat-containing protein, partial [Planctomycetota bacterium]
MKSIFRSFAFLMVVAPYIIFSSEPVHARPVDPNEDPSPREILYTVTASAGSNGSVSPGQVTVSSGESASFTATADDGYEVDEWSVDGEVVKQGGNSLTVSDIQADHRVYVTFTARQYTLAATAGPDGSVSPAQVSVDSGDDATFTATADDGYEVDEWSVDGEVVKQGGNSLTVSDIQADHRIHVTFESVQYTITATAGSNGSVDPTDVTVDYGGDATFTATADLGYAVDGWYLDGEDVQTGGTSCTVSDIDADYSLHVTFRRALSYSLGDLDFDDDEEFRARTVNNNLIEPDRPEESRLHVKRIVGIGPDPSGAMVMYNLKDIDPTSVNYGRIINARVKGTFMKTDADRILVRFKYLFATPEPGVKLAVYFSDVPELLAPDDPLRQQHYLEVARIPARPFPRPGSAGSGRFAVFQKIVWIGHLNFGKALYIELELLQPPTNGVLLANNVQKVAAGRSGSPSADMAVLTDSGGGAYIDSWRPAVQCYGICLDINWDNFVDEADFLMVVGGYGLMATG